jgi:hypothetical protein
VEDKEKEKGKERERQKESEKEGVKEGDKSGEKEGPISGLNSGIRGSESFSCRVGCISLLTQLISRYVTSSTSTSSSTSSSSPSSAHSNPPFRSTHDSVNNKNSENGENENSQMEYNSNDEHYDPRYEKMKRLHLFRKYGGDVMFVTLITDSDTRSLEKKTSEHVRTSTEHSTDTDSGGVGTGPKGMESSTQGPTSVQRPVVHLPLSDRHFALWVLRETVVGAGEEGVGREMKSLLSCLIWLLGCPTSHTHTLSKSRSPSPSPTLTPPQQPISSAPTPYTAVPYSLPDYLFSTSAPWPGSRTEIPPPLCAADRPVISVFLKILILQEIRLLLWGNDAKPLIPEGNPSKNIRLPLLDSFVPNTLDTSSHTNQSSNSLHSSLFFFRPKKDEPLAFQGPKGPSETPLLSSSLGNICVSNYPTKRALIALGSIETLLCIIIGELCPYPIKEIFRKHVRTYVQCIRDSVKTMTKGSLTECEVEMWWSALSTLGHLCAGCDEAKEMVDRCLGEGVFIRALLPLANITPRESDTPGGLYSEGKEGRRRNPRPLSVSTGLESTVPTCSVIISQLLLEMCVGGEAGRISTPSRPFIAITTAAPPASTSLSSSTSSSYLSADTMSHLGSYALPTSLSAHFSYPFSGTISTPKHPFPLPSQNPENTPIVPLSETASAATTSFSTSTVESENIPMKKDENLLPLPSTLTLKQHLPRPSIAYHLSFTNFSNALNSKENYINQENVRYSKYGHCSDYYTSPIDTDVEIFGRDSVPLPPLSALSPFYYVHEESLAQFQACLEPATLSCTYDCFGLYFCTGDRDVTDDIDSLMDSPRARGASGVGLSGLGVGTGTGLGSGRREQIPQNNPSTPAANTPTSSIFNIFSSKKENRITPGGTNTNPVPANSIRKRGSFSANLSSNSLSSITPSNHLNTRVGSFRNISDENRWENESLKGSVTGRTGGKKSSHQTPSLVTLRQVLSTSEFSPPHIFPLEDNGQRKMSTSSASATVSLSGFEDFNHSHHSYTPNPNLSSSTSNIQGLRRSGNSGLLGTNMGSNLGSNYGSKSRGTRGSVASSTNNSTHGFGPSPGYGLGLLGTENVETASICSEINRNPVKSDASTGYCNVYVPLFAVLEDGLGHSDSSASVLCLLHSALLLKSGLFHTVEPAEEEACGDSLLDYDEAEERDSLIDNESIASGTSYWGQNKGFGSSFFAAVVGAGTSWISGGKGPEKWGPGPLSPQLLLENNVESGRNVNNNVQYGVHNSGLPNGRVRSSTYLSQQWEPSVKGNSICGDDPPAGDNSLLYIRRRNSGFGGVLGDSTGKENVVVGLSSLSAELQLQSLKRQLLRFLPPPPTISPQDLTVPVGSKVRSGNFFTLFSSRSPVRYALKSLLGGTATNTKFENTDLLKKPLFQDSFTSAWSPSFSRLKIRSLECAKILLAFSCGEKSTIQSIFLAAFSNLVDGNPENGALLTSDSTFVVNLMETLLGIEREKGGGTGMGSGSWPMGGGTGTGSGTGGVMLAEDPVSTGRTSTGTGPALQRRKINGSGLSHLLSQILRYNVTEVRICMEFEF